MIRNKNDLLDMKEAYLKKIGEYSHMCLVCFGTGCTSSGCKKVRDALVEEEGKLEKRIGELNQIIGKAENQKKAREDLEKATAERKIKQEALKPLEEALEREKDRAKETEQKSAELARIRDELREYEALDRRRSDIAKAEKAQQQRKN